MADGAPTIVSLALTVLYSVRLLSCINASDARHGHRLRRLQAYKSLILPLAIAGYGHWTVTNCGILGVFDTAFTSRLTTIALFGLALLARLGQVILFSLLGGIQARLSMLLQAGERWRVKADSWVDLVSSLSWGSLAL